MNKLLVHLSFNFGSCILGQGPAPIYDTLSKKVRKMKSNHNHHNIEDPYVARGIQFNRHITDEFTNYRHSKLTKHE